MWQGLLFYMPQALACLVHTKTDAYAELGFHVLQHFFVVQILAQLLTQQLQPWKTGSNPWAPFAKGCAASSVLGRCESWWRPPCSTLRCVVVLQAVQHHGRQL